MGGRHVWEHHGAQSVAPPHFLEGLGYVFEGVGARHHALEVETPCTMVHDKRRYVFGDADGAHLGAQDRLVGGGQLAGSYLDGHVVGSHADDDQLAHGGLLMDIRLLEE